MGRPVKPVVLQPASDPHDISAGQQQTQQQQHRIDLGDGAAIKRTLDEIAGQVARDTMASTPDVLHIKHTTVTRKT